jgi:phage terminase small subunit
MFIFQENWRCCSLGELKSKKQEKFCQLYAATGNATQSWKDAGYKYTSENGARVAASNFVNKNPNIKARLAELAEEAKTYAIADIQEMQSVLTAIIREELDEEKLMSENWGEGVSRIVSKRQKAALKDRLKAIELLGKMQGAFVDNVNIKGTVPITFVDDLED